jgi:hypothetical protein
MKKISIICVVRNDNYGLHQVDRTSGDFFGISKKNFSKIKGYREYWTYGVYDGIICKDSKSVGLKQFILPKYSVHIDHSRPHLNSKTGTNYNLQELNDFEWGLNNNNEISVIKYYIN